MFDVVSGALSAQIPTRNRQSTKLMLALLRDAVRHEPEKLSAVLHEVASLKPEDLDDLARLLGEKSLPAIIRSANVVASRTKFLLALDHLLHDPIGSSVFGERDHLHRILEHELWVFGEGYTMMSSERGLTEVLRSRLVLEGLPDPNPGPVARWDGRTGPVDLHLAARAHEHDRTRHLLVELKAPDVRIERRELDQVENYADVIAEDPCFASHSIWDIILVGTSYDRIAAKRITDPFSGQCWAHVSDNGPSVRIFLRRWSDILAENRRRLAFTTSRLEHDPTIGESLGWVRENYSQIIPEGLLTPTGTATTVLPAQEPHAPGAQQPDLSGPQV